MNKFLLVSLFTFCSISGSLCAMQQDNIVMTRLPYSCERHTCQTFSDVCAMISQMTVEQAYVFCMQDLQSFCSAHHICVQQSDYRFLSDIFTALSLIQIVPGETLLSVLCGLRGQHMHLVQDFMTKIGFDFVDSEGNNLLQLAIKKDNIDLIGWIGVDRFQRHEAVIPGYLSPFDQVAIDSMFKD